jgi:hypothetical protein
MYEKPRPIEAKSWLSQHVLEWKLIIETSADLLAFGAARSVSPQLRALLENPRRISSQTSRPLSTILTAETASAKVSAPRRAAQKDDLLTLNRWVSLVLSSFALARI